MNSRSSSGVSSVIVLYCLARSTNRAALAMESRSFSVRAELVRRFNGGEVSVFLISLRAGGTGLNLTAADIVIHYDPWWNVAAQNQATDRAYRIGQQNPVQVYKLIAQDTIEEKIVELQQAKQSLADTVTGTADGAILSMRPDELLQLLEGSEP